MPSHTPQIRAWFNLPSAAPRPARARRPVPSPPAPGQILWITGPSGAGKSSLLRQMRRKSPSLWIDLHRLRLPDRPVVDCFGDLPLQRILPLLSRLGLAEVWTYLRPPRSLSTGQRFRLRIALALARAADAPGAILACDEFAATLDPLTAAIAAHALRRAITPLTPVRAILAGSRDDLHPALQPDQTLHCDFGTWTLKT